MENHQLRIAGVVNDSIVDGPGYRFTIFTQGCPHRCPGCHNPQTHDPKGGSWIDTDELMGQILENPLLEGVTFSGGEPFSQAEILAQLGREIKKHGLSLWCYSGYTLESLLAMNKPSVNHLLEVADVLVDGPFILEERDLELSFRGSRNQRLIDLPASLASGQAVMAVI